MPDNLRNNQTAPPTAAPEGALPAHAHTMIGEYSIIRLIGEGGMGAVYEAEQPAPRRTVALKVIRAGLATPALLRRFETEAEILGRLQHPGIAQIYEAGTAESGAGVQPFFAMELVRGDGGRSAPTLSEYVLQKNLPTREKLELLARLTDAVHYAHQRGVIHRDLKPGNVLVDALGQPKILDFGVARVTDADVQSTTLQTDVGVLIGTLAYMSPEQAAGDPHELDTRSDVYALGVIAYEILVGKPPYELQRKMVHEAIRVIQNEEPTRLSRIDRALRGDVETIIAKALEKDRTLRYQSANDFGADIRRYLNDEPIIARPPNTLYQLRKFARRHRALTASILLVSAALVLGIMGTSIGLARATIQRNRAETAEAQQRVELTRIYIAAAELARQRGNFPAVLDNLDKALAIGADEADVRLRRARALIDSTRMPEAAAELDHVKTLKRTAALEAQWNLLQGRLTRVVDAERSMPFFRAALHGPLAPAEEHYVRAQLAGTTSQAVREYHVSLDADPYGRAASTELAMFETFIGSADQALARLDALLLIYPDDRELRAVRLLAVYASRGRDAFDHEMNDSSVNLDPGDVRLTRSIVDMLESMGRDIDGDNQNSVSLVGQFVAGFGALDQASRRASTRPGESGQAIHFPALFKRFLELQVKTNVVGLFASPAKNEAMLGESIDVLPMPFLLLSRAALRLEGRRFDEAETDLKRVESAGATLLDTRASAASMMLSVMIDRQTPFKDEAARVAACHQVLETVQTYHRTHARIPPSMAMLAVTAAQRLEDWPAAGVFAGSDLSNLSTRNARLRLAEANGSAAELVKLGTTADLSVQTRVARALIENGGTAPWDGVRYNDKLLFDLSDPAPLIGTHVRPTPATAFDPIPDRANDPSMVTVAMDVAGDGQFIVVSQRVNEQSSLRIIRLSDWRTVKTILVSGDSRQVMFALNGRVLIESAEVDGVPRVRFWGVRSGQMLEQLFVPAEALRMDPAGLVVTASDRSHRASINLRTLRVEEYRALPTTRPSIEPVLSPTGDAAFTIVDGRVAIRKRAMPATRAVGE